MPTPESWYGEAERLRRIADLEEMRELRDYYMGRSAEAAHHMWVGDHGGGNVSPDDHDSTLQCYDDNGDRLHDMLCNRSDAECRTAEQGDRDEPLPILRAPLNFKALRIEKGWPTPNYMRQAADGLDKLAAPRYGDILRWVADACDAWTPEIP